MEQLSLKDKKVIAKQIGRTPRGVLGVERRCPYGYPQVVCVHPLVEGKPFPTLFWLTCPFLTRQIDHLEAEGWIKKMDGQIEHDETLAASLREAHRTYITERDRLLSPEDRETLEKAGMLKDLQDKGIGGTADFEKVKCLHLHVAHALARENPVGTHVLGALQNHACPPKQVICSEFEQLDQT